MHERKEHPVEHDERDVVRLQNRALRMVVRGLRRKTERVQAHSDTLFVALCESDMAAGRAMRRLWEEGGFQPPCGPEDYQEIVDTAVRALQILRVEQAKAGATLPTQSRSAVET